jgi:hypothetical protein
MNKREADILQDIDPEEVRVIEGQQLLNDLCDSVEELQEHEVQLSTADGICFQGSLENRQVEACRLSIPNEQTHILTSGVSLTQLAIHLR